MSTIRTLMRWQVRWAMLSVGKLWIHVMLMSGVPKHTAMKMLSAKWNEIEREMY